MTRNAEALRELAEHLNRNSRYDQTVWGAREIRITAESCDNLTVDIKECGTQQCIAGHAVALAGRVPVVKCNTFDRLYNEVHVMVDWGFVRPATGGRYASTPEVARRILGLSREDAAILFHGSWEPRVSLRKALLALADGASIKSVTSSSSYDFITTPSPPDFNEYLEVPPVISPNKRVRVTV